jgi:hypothetical protein
MKYLIRDEIHNVKLPDSAVGIFIGEIIYLCFVAEVNIFSFIYKEERIS